MSIPTLIFRTIRWSAQEGCEAGLEHVDLRPSDGGLTISGVVVGREDEAAMKAFRNLPEAQLVLDEELNAYDVLCNDWIIFTRATVPTSEERQS